jgi:hypothetical protein
MREETVGKYKGKQKEVHHQSRKISYEEKKYLSL